MLHDLNILSDNSIIRTCPAMLDLRVVAMYTVALFSFALAGNATINGRRGICILGRLLRELCQHQP